MKNSEKVLAKYDPAKIESKWQKKWTKDKIYKSQEEGSKKKGESKKDKFYVLDMFPYPSGEGLHVGHPKGYIATDIISRMNRMQGKNVLHPMGFDAFGLPAENYALKMKKNPMDLTKVNVDRFKEQLELVGLDYDWSREVNTTDPEYYKWTQWAFLQMYKKGLAYESFEPINWCPSCKTGLANEDVEDGRCERCGTPVEKKPLRQWVLKITDYAERLLADLDAQKMKAPMIEVTQSEFAFRVDRKIVKRDCILAIVKHWEKDEYLVLSAPKYGWNTFVIGGIEKGEDPIEAGKREIIEETGFTDFKFIKQLGGQVLAKHFAPHKDENRLATLTGLYFELKSSKQKAIDKSESDHQKINWVPKDKVAGILNPKITDWAFWNRFRGNESLLTDPCFVETDEPGIVKPELPFVERDALLVIVKHWSEDKYIGLKWKKVAWQTLLTGAPENGQTPEEGAVAEIIQETGYLHPKFVKNLGKVHSKFYHVPKKVNRFAHFDILYFELKDGEKQEMSKEDQGIHEVVWLSKDQVSDFLTPAAHQYAWSKFQGESFKVIEETVPLLDWPNSIKEAQRNWIGKSEGALIKFKIQNSNFQKASDDIIEVFTTRPDTLFGVTYVVLAPEHSLVSELINSVSNKKEVEAYVAQSKLESEIERTDAKKEKIGVELKGVKVINPANGEDVPVWIADYVLADYGTGAVMAVPAHDDRDFAFAKKFGLVIKEVIAPLFIEKNNSDAFRDGTSTNKRNTVSCIVKHWSEDKYLCLQWMHDDWKGFSIGGIEEGENLEQAARRELHEETGYKNAKFVRTLGSEINYKFFASHKNENRWNVGHGVYLELLNGEQDEVAEHEKKLHGVVWIDKENVAKFIEGDPNDSLLWKRFNDDQFNNCFTEEGVLINSASFSGKSSDSVRKDITLSVGGKWVTKFKLRDWVFSRQRYWGEPIPLIHCEKCGVVPVPEKDLPVELPKVKSYEPTGTGESPLAAIEKWVNVKCPKCVEEKDKTKYFIFDFDGVLGDTWEASLEAYVKGNFKKNKEEAAQDMFDYFSKKPSHTRNHSLTSAELKENWDWTMRFGTEMTKLEFSLFKEFIKEIKKFNNTKFAVVSSGSSQYVLPAVKKTGLKGSHVLTYEDHHSKEEKIEHICKDWGINVKDVYYFTDTKADVYELENLLDKKKIIGCSWGYHGLEKLKEVLPEKQILKDFTAIHRFFNTDCMAKRETNTMPQWAGSSWYYLRYMNPKNKKALVDPKKEKYWAPVDLYVGGAEHATRHLIYARFWHKFLYDIGVVSTIEPFIKLQSVGLIMGEDGRKMSKRFGNVINPDDIIKSYGADSLRLYEMFMGPFDQSIAWSTSSIVGVRRFIEKVWRLQERLEIRDLRFENESQSANSIDKILHKAIKKVTADIQVLGFNTAISTLMITVNEIEKIIAENSSNQISRIQFELLLKLIAPFAPHVTEELWYMLGNKKSIHISEWPVCDENLIVDDEVNIMVQVNGKVRGSFKAQKDWDEAILEAKAKEIPDVKKWLEGKFVKKVIVIKGKLVSIVVS